MTSAPPQKSQESRKPRSRTFLVIAVLAVLAVLGGAVEPWAYATFVDTSAKDRIAADPPPTLFSDSDIRPIEHRVDAQPARAERLMAGWWKQHGSTADDAEFVTWLEQTLPPPPSPSRRAKEIKEVQAIAKTRTSAGVTAATWLEAYGKNDIWNLAAHDQAELLPATTGEALKNHVSDATSMAKDVADALGTKDQQSAPYVVDPSLRTDKTVNPGDVCPCSYPSRHATAGAAAATYLSYTSPHRSAQYRWTLDEVAWSRVYMAGHVPSDITAGALLGDMIGEYVLVTHGQMPVPTS
jgi:membrane-associated phospholipid phosphatase